MDIVLLGQPVLRLHAQVSAQHFLFDVIPFFVVLARMLGARSARAVWSACVPGIEKPGDVCAIACCFNAVLHSCTFRALESFSCVLRAHLLCSVRNSAVLRARQPPRSDRLRRIVRVPVSRVLYCQGFIAFSGASIVVLLLAELRSTEPRSGDRVE